MDTPIRTRKKYPLDILLDKIVRMREDLLTIERALERMQRETMQLTDHRNGNSRAAR